MKFHFLFAVALPGALLLTGCPGSGDSGISPDGAQQSTNWAGYVKAGGPGSFNQASGSWAVPDVLCGNSDKDSSSWTGVGGGTTADPTLVQAGTSQTCSGGQADYAAWWEVLPAPSVNAGGFLDTATYPVGPGDQINVSVDGSNAVVWDITIHNATRNWTFNTTVAYSAAGATAEWIEESPLSAGSAGLADFGHASFFASRANNAAANLQLSDRVVMTDGAGTVIANTSAPGGGGDFGVCYGAGNC